MTPLSVVPPKIISATHWPCIAERLSYSRASEQRTSPKQMDLAGIKDIRLDNLFNVRKDCSQMTDNDFAAL